MKLNNQFQSYRNRSSEVKAYLEDKEIGKLEGAADNLRDRLLIRLLSRSGCRISEALGKKVEDVDIVNQTITMLRSKG